MNKVEKVFRDIGGPSKCYDELNDLCKEPWKRRRFYFVS